MTHSPTPEELAALKVANAALMSADSSYDYASTIVFALGSAQQLQSLETVARAARHREELRIRRNEDMALRDALLHARRPVPFELGTSLVPAVQWLIARVDELGARVAELQAAQSRQAPVIQPPHCDCYATAGRYESDGSRARPGAHDPECLTVTTRLAPVEDPHDSPLHHRYVKGRDLPVPCAECQEPSPGGRAFCSTRCRNAADRHDADDHLAEETTHAEL